MKVALIIIALIIISGISYYLYNQSNSNRTLNTIQTSAQNLNPYTPFGYQIVSKGIRNELPNGLIHFLTAMQSGTSRVVIDMRPKMSLNCNDGTIKTISSYSVCERLLSTTYLHWDKDNTTFVLTTNDNSLPLPELEKIVSSL